MTWEPGEMTPTEEAMLADHEDTTAPGHLTGHLETFHVDPPIIYNEFRFQAPNLRPGRLFGLTLVAAVLAGPFALVAALGYTAGRWAWQLLL